MSSQTSNRAVLFDLDGTLVDTAPDLINALKAVCEHADRPFPQRTDWSGLVSQGAAGLIDVALGELAPEEKEAYLAFFLSHYEAHLYQDSKLFEGMDSLLAACRASGWHLGVVTNKRSAFAQSILDQAGLSDHFGVVIGGDTLARNKPAPDPVWAACKILATTAERAVLIGDDERDLVSAKRAGALGIVAGWGYGISGIQPQSVTLSQWCNTPAEVYEALIRWAGDDVD